MTYNHKEFAQNSINYLVEQKTTRDLTEAIAICVRNLKDTEGKLVRVSLCNDFLQEMAFYEQIAKMLRNESTE